MKALVALMSLLVTLAMYGCGGGGGGDDEDTSVIDTTTDTIITPLAYTGNTEPSLLTTTNAKFWVDLFFGSDDSASGLYDEPALSSEKTISSVTGLTSTLSTSSKELTTALSVAQESVNELLYCSVSGTLHITGTVSSNYTAELSMDYDQCDDGELYYDGIVHLSIIGYDITYDLITNGSMSFNLLHARGDFGDITSSGSFSVIVDIYQAIEKTTSNLIMRDNLTQRFSMVENMITTALYDSYFAPSLAEVTVSGKMYDEIEGYVVVSTLDVLSYSVPSSQYPIGGGPLLMTGANNSSIKVTPISETELSIDVDNDGDGTYESIAGTEWLILDDDTSVTFNTIPIADAGDDLTVIVNNSVALDGSSSQDPDGDYLLYSWAIIEQPDESTSATLSNADNAIAQFTADVTGTYKISLVVNDGTVNSTASTVLVNAFDLHALNYRVIDAEYNQQFDNIVMVSDTPPALHVFDVATQSEQTISLLLPPTSVAVSRDGENAVVGHDGMISHVDLQTPALMDNFPVSIDVFDIVMADKRYAYAFPHSSGLDYIRAIELETGTEMLHFGELIHGDTKAKLHPREPYIYGANNELTSSNIEKYSIKEDIPVYLYDSPYDGDYESCGYLWITEDGLTLFTKCGYVFRSSDLNFLDLFLRSLNTLNTRIAHADHSIDVNKIAVILEVDPTLPETLSADTAVSIYDRSYLALDKNIELPEIESNGLGYPLHGRYVFYTRTGQHIVLLVQSDPEAGLENEYFVVRF
jgi:hypothetical protein